MLFSYDIFIISYIFVEFPIVQRIVYYWNMKTVIKQEVLARFGHAISDPTRVSILLALRAGAHYPAELADQLDVSKQSLSNHLACLRGCGLVTTSPEGRRTRYELSDPKLEHALNDLLEVVLMTNSQYCDDEE